MLPSLRLPGYRVLKQLLQITCGLAGIAVLVGLAPRAYTAIRYRQQVYNASEAPAGRAAVVFGAGLVMDYAGRSTYDTCYRAHAIFGLTSAVLVTQAFHLPRALYLCDALGMNTVGVVADRRDYRQRTELYWNVREIFATAAAWWDVTIAHPVPVLGEPISIS